MARNDSSYTTVGLHLKKVSPRPLLQEGFLRRFGNKRQGRIERKSYEAIYLMPLNGVRVNHLVRCTTMMQLDNIKGKYLWHFNQPKKKLVSILAILPTVQARAYDLIYGEIRWRESWEGFSLSHIGNSRDTPWIWIKMFFYADLPRGAPDGYLTLNLDW